MVTTLSGLIYYTYRVTFPAPENCKACHFIAPYYKKWQASAHNKVPCLKCHEYTPIKAIAGQFLYLAGGFNPRPITNVPDENCLQSGCHEKRLVESKVIFTKLGISFDHKKHFVEMKRDIKLHCRSCHSDIAQGEHLKVSMSVCFFCHFKTWLHDKTIDSCPSCHSAPKWPIAFKGKNFLHADALKAGYACKQCHVQITKGEGITPEEKCYFCHVDRVENYNDIKLIHDKHVTQLQIDCLWCHPKIEHGNIKMADDMPFLK